MNKKIFKAVTAVFTSCVILLGCTSCAIGSHTHKYSKYVYDDKVHWKECSCGEMTNDKEHSWEEVKVVKVATCEADGENLLECKCGATKSGTIPKLTHGYDEEWSFDETYHWKAAICGCDRTSSKQHHIFQGGANCSICGYGTEDASPSKDVVYKLSEDKTYAEVVGYNVYSGVVVIADTYEGVPVESIGERAFYAKGITAIRLPNTLKVIKREAFSGSD